MNNTTELVFILDRSGSMSGFESDTVSGFNSMIREQSEKEGEVLVSTVLFDTDSTVLHDRVPIGSVRSMELCDYRPGGGTALLDALGGAIHHIGNIHKYAREEDVPAHTVFVITTDGMENASRHYDAQTVKRAVKRQTEKYGWEFIFLAANIDAIETAGGLGIKRDRAANFTQSQKGMEECYMAMSAFVSERRAMPKGRVSEDWKKNLK